MATEKAETGPLWWAGVAVIGLVFLALGYGALPVGRESLVTVEIEAPLPVRRVLVEGSGRNPDNYFTQRLKVALPGNDSAEVSPVRKLLIPEIEDLKRGTVRFLIDPLTRQIYEASLDGRVLLSYIRSAGTRRRNAFIAMLVGLFCVGVGALGLAPVARTGEKTPARPES